MWKKSDLKINAVEQLRNNQHSGKWLGQVNESLQIHFLKLLNQVMHIVLILGLVLRLMDGCHLLHYLLYLVQDVLLLFSLEHAYLLIGKGMAAVGVIGLLGDQRGTILGRDIGALVRTLHQVRIVGMGLLHKPSFILAFYFHLYHYLINQYCNYMQIQIPSVATIHKNRYGNKNKSPISILFSLFDMIELKHCLMQPSNNGSSTIILFLDREDTMLPLLVLLTIASCQYPWIKPDQLNYGLPPSVSIYTLHTSTSPFNTKLTGGYAKFNMNDSNLEFIVKDTIGDALGYFPKTPIQYAEQEQNVVYAVINGGYFNMAKNTSSSFLCEQSRIKTRNAINEEPDKHPTVGAFGLTADGKLSAQFIYSYQPLLTTYKFQRPNVIPGPVISPSLGQIWNVKEGIGAGPILVKNFSVIEGNVENFDKTYMIDTRHPRSAICIDMNNNLYLVAIDGRYEYSDGMKMSEIAQLMQSLNCKEALNLDGGGSTMLFANNRTINRPCDPTGPRPVVSAIVIRDRHKKKFTSSQQ